jgi:hypothetical protein
MCVPQHIKVFVWRMLGGCLPTCEHQDKGVDCLDICPYCENRYENEWYIFVGCEKMKQIWMEAGLLETIAGFVNTTTYR